MSTLRPYATLWRRTRTAILAGSIALSTVLAPAGVAIALDTGATASTADGTSGAGGEFVWEGDSLENATAIVRADGDGLTMRAEPALDAAAVTSIPSGTVVALRIDETDSVQVGGTRWWPVEYNGQDGWVAGDYLTGAGGLAPGSAPFEFDGGSLEGAQARVSSDGGLRLRVEPSASAESLVTIPDGTVVDLRIADTDTVYDPDGVTRWWPVRYDGQDGWVSGLFLVSVSGATTTVTSTTSTDTTTTVTSSTTTTAREPFAWDGGPLEGATAIAAGDGQNVNVRLEPTASSEIVAKVPDGTVVNLRIDRVDTVVEPGTDTRWWPVEVDGVEGWISGSFLTDGAAPGNATSSLFPAGSTALVQTQSGSGAKLRSAAGSGGEQIGSIPERATVTVLGGPASNENSQNGWFQVQYNGQTGYVDGDLLVLIATPVAEEPAAQPTQAPATEEPTAAPTEPAQQPTEAPGQPTATEAAEDEETPTAGMTPVRRATEDDQTPTATATEGAETPTPRPTQPPAQSGSSQFVLPVSGAVKTQGFGCSSLGFYPYNPDWGCGVHDGIDYAAPAYTPIVAAADGTVVTAGWCDCGLGYYVEIDHGNNLHTIYGHMATQPYVSVGQQVSQGQEIGPVGSTGLSTGPHVHFMVQVNGISQDPARYLP